MATTVYDYSGLVNIESKALQAFSDGTLLSVFDVEASDVIRLYYSAAGGGSWAQAENGTITTYANPSSRGVSSFIDDNDVIWVAYRQASGALRIDRGTFSGSTITWQTGYDFASSANIESIDVTAFTIGTDDWVILTVANTAIDDVLVYVVKRTSGGTWSVEQTLTAYAGTTLTSPIAVRVDFEHTGNGKTPATNPHFWVAYTKNTDASYVYGRKYTWGSGPTWSQGAERTLAAVPSAGQTQIGMAYDAANDLVLVSYVYHSSPNYTRFAEWDGADTPTITDRYPGGDSLQTITYRYNSGLTLGPNGDVYLFGRDLLDEFFYNRYDRAGDRWSGWTRLTDNTTGIYISPLPYALDGVVELVREDTNYDVIYDSFPVFPTAGYPRITGSSWGQDDTPTSDTNSVATLPTGIVAGELLIGVFSHTSGLTGNPSGWTLLTPTGDNLLGINSADVRVLCRRADGGEGATIAFTNLENNQLSWTIHRVADAGDPDMGGSWASGSGTTGANPPSKTVDQGEYLFMTPHAGQSSANPYSWGAPIGYARLEKSTANDCSVCLPYKHVSGTSDDPSIWQYTYAETDISLTLAIPYAPGYVPGFGLGFGDMLLVPA